MFDVGVVNVLQYFLFIYNLQTNALESKVTNFFFKLVLTLKTK